MLSSIIYCTLLQLNVASAYPSFLSNIDPSELRDDETVTMLAANLVVHRDQLVRSRLTLQKAIKADISRIKSVVDDAKYVMIRSAKTGQPTSRGRYVYWGSLKPTLMILVTLQANSEESVDWKMDKWSNWIATTNADLTFSNATQFLLAAVTPVPGVKSDRNFCQLVYHELAHCSGGGHGTGSYGFDIIVDAGFCMSDVVFS